MLDPSVRMKLHEIYTQSFYGSNLWNLFDNNCDKIYRAYNISVRNTFQVPRNTHRYLIEVISRSTHPKVFLSSRFVKFKESLNNCHKISIRILAKLYENDQRTVYGKNLGNIAQLCNVTKELLCPSLVKEQMNYFSPPVNEQWRSSVVQELLEVKRNNMDLQGFENEEITEMLS